MNERRAATSTLDVQVDAALAASRVFVALIAESMEDIESTVSPLQFRTLVIVCAKGSLNVTSLAELLGVHPSNATRVCDRLVRGGLLARTQSDSDRRHLEITLTRAGRRLVEGVMDRRRTALTRVLARMPSAKRLQFTQALQSFGNAAGEDFATGPSHYEMSLTYP